VVGLCGKKYVGLGMSVEKDFLRLNMDLTIKKDRGIRIQ
jgi:hypothetical protein